MLLGVGDGEPVLEQLDARARQHLFELRHAAEEFLVLFVVAETHDPLDPGTVVPAAVEQDDLATGRQVRDVALEIPLGLLAVVRRGQRGDPADPRVEALGDALDHAALARRVASLEENHHLVPGVHHPVLQFHQFPLQAEQFAEIAAPTQFAGRILLLGTEQLVQVQLVVEQFLLQLFVVSIEPVATDAARGIAIGVHALLSTSCRNTANARRVFMTVW